MLACTQLLQSQDNKTEVYLASVIHKTQLSSDVAEHGTDQQPYILCKSHEWFTAVTMTMTYCSKTAQSTNIVFKLLSSSHLSASPQSLALFVIHNRVRHLHLK